MTGITCAVAGSGSYISTVVVTVGYSNPGPGVTLYGYDGLQGSVSPSTWNVFSINVLYYEVDSFRVVFEVLGVAPNSGWTTMNIAGTDFTRASATYSSTPSTASWSWESVVTNPFGTTVGATKTVTWI
jgi:hypothetical protein